MSATPLIFAALQIGFVTGFRAFTPLALISWLSVWGWMPLAGSSLWFLGTTLGAVVTSVLALGELIGDKLPQTPDRISPSLLGARLVTGTLCGAAICLAGGQPWVGGIVGGGIGSIIGAHAGYYVRRALVRKVGVPDFVVAVIEDAATIGGALLILSSVFSHSV